MIDRKKAYECWVTCTHTEAHTHTSINTHTHTDTYTQTHTHTNILDLRALWQVFSPACMIHPYRRSLQSQHSYPQYVTNDQQSRNWWANYYKEYDFHLLVSSYFVIYSKTTKTPKPWLKERKYMNVYECGWHSHLPPHMHAHAHTHRHTLTHKHSNNVHKHTVWF